MPDDTPHTPIHWTEIESGVDDEGMQIPCTTDQMAAHYAAATIAYNNAYGAAIRGPNLGIAHLMRDDVDRFLLPSYAAFTAAAALKGWNSQKIDQVTEDGQAMIEWAWQWLGEAGITDDTIRRLTCDLNADQKKQTTVTTRWFCRTNDGQEHTIPNEAYGREHTATRNCALIKRTTRTETIDEG